MNMRQLRYFVQIVDSGSLAKASRQLFIAQPALSQHVAKLEEEVGTPLLQRSSRGVVPTENGAAVYQHAKFLLRQLQETVAVAQQVPSGLGGRVTLGLPPNTVRRLGQALLERMEEKFPAIRLNIVEAANRQLGYMTQVGQLDLAVLFSPHAASDLQVQPLFDEELFVILPADSALVPADRHSLTLREIARLPLVLQSLHHPAHRRRIELEFDRAGLPLKPLAEIDSLHLLMGAVERRGAATIQPHAAVHAFGDPAGRWRWLRIADVRVVRRNYLYALSADKLPTAGDAVRAELQALVRRSVETASWEGIALPAEADCEDTEDGRELALSE
ncbi:LysR family transcriptional regulator [Ramlibacter sp. G-1-2-2]|uniref:LysR family transcriptional regulator n=1 Tax=Ramlibacter agri TaxID=2728837 RepID=A0A848GXD1_9BURK|nr:LysR substrate-binding domain-containing protein [Ramlibacter agri]NML42807.1 LysR family transcriptional regulator [Ramlibacter agri]